MNREKTPGKQLPHGTGAERDSLGSQRTALLEENTFSFTEPSLPDGAPGATMTQESLGVVEYVTTASDPRPQVTRHRQQGDLSDAQLRLLQNLERLTHSLRGPEQSLDRVSYNRPFPPTIKSARS
jgi:hypothetical protein